ncbi:META domain containing protein putative (META2) [Leptomonas seymouri]|uniref:META domain containing protein putative (META2) n=1 Tax=Leptomonas seymouri TaxID=5684 RepID=A0A0N0P5L4_LEPSE|nr:META domain containing protein putative (META2) [Leptomonas seymouri]|eukprot:KPI86606.1 META domain containing protein putative (META2) [Leptomonas seymouri]
MTTVDEICGTYALSHWEGKAAPVTATLTIYRCGDDVTVDAVVANGMTGQMRYEPNYLVGNLELVENQELDKNQEDVEQALIGGFADGFHVVLEASKLLLKNSTTSFVFVQSARLSDIFGEHAIIAINNQPPNREMTMRFFPDGNGGSFVVASIANSLRGQCQIESGLLRGELASTMIEADTDLAAVESEIRDGLHNGFQVSKNESGVLLRSASGSIQLCQIVSQSDLKGEYLLKSYNGQPVLTTHQATISFAPKGEKEVSISIFVANRIRGTAVLDQNILTSDEPLMSTRLVGTPAESSLESAFNVGFQYGVEAILRCSELTLKNQDCEFVLTRTAIPEVKHSDPTYKGTHCTKCFKAESNGLLFRIVNENEKKWAFHNDTENYRMHIQASFGSRSSIVPLNNAQMHQEDGGRFIVEVTVNPLTTEMFIQGDVNGFKIAYSAQPI